MSSNHVTAVANTVDVIKRTPEGVGRCRVPSKNDTSHDQPARREAEAKPLACTGPLPASEDGSFAKRAPYPNHPEPGTWRTGGPLGS